MDHCNNQNMEKNPSTQEEEQENPAVVQLLRRRIVEGQDAPQSLDSVAAEEPLEIQIQGQSIAVLMRTPGFDEDLVRGFMVSEGLVTKPCQILRIFPCTTPSHREAEDNIYQVHLTRDAPTWRGKERNFYASSSCGICGKGSIEAVRLNIPPWRESIPIFPPHEIHSMPSRLRASQDIFQHTGGVHAAALFEPQQETPLVREDVGRHNATDKVIGAALSRSDTISGCGLFVSGRISFEIVQKAAMAGIRWVGGISAPTSLAVASARELGMEVVGFVRDQSFVAYSLRPTETPSTTTEKE